MFKDESEYLHSGGFYAGLFTIQKGETESEEPDSDLIEVINEAWSECCVGGSTPSPFRPSGVFKARKEEGVNAWGCTWESKN